jgi:hypothetical protein
MSPRTALYGQGISLTGSSRRSWLSPKGSLHPGSSSNSSA